MMVHYPDTVIAAVREMIAATDRAIADLEAGRDVAEIAADWHRDGSTAHVCVEAFVRSRRHAFCGCYCCPLNWCLRDFDPTEIQVRTAFGFAGSNIGSFLLPALGKHRNWLTSKLNTALAGEKGKQE